MGGRANRDKQVCTFCGRSYTTTMKLKIHIADYHTPDSDKKHPCNICGKLFGALQTLNKHLKIHGSKKYRCTLCNYASTKKYNVANIHVPKMHKITENKGSYVLTMDDEGVAKPKKSSGVGCSKRSPGVLAKGKINTPLKVLRVPPIPKVGEVPEEEEEGESNDWSTAS